MAKYDHKSVEAKWQKEWEDSGLHKVEEDPAKKKFYALDMFPYPSGSGLHVGHPEGYTASDIVTRKRRMEGWNVLHPMGFDAFGLPAENYAIKTGVHPRESTQNNIANFRRQLRSLGFMFDWSREVSTCDPAYYRWTQWMFLFLYKNDLAYKGVAPVNWCESCHTVLANEQVIDGTCERCKNEVVQKELSQWFFRVTTYADRLLADIEKVEWPEKIKAMQRNWIGRSEGTKVVFSGTDAEGDTFEVPVFTTRPDTLFGVSYVVLAPEHELVARLTSASQKKEVEQYVAHAQSKSALERTGTQQEKTGVALGVTVKNPLSGREIPLWIADYALATYGTGAVMGVPAHDERDYVFAKKYHLPVLKVIEPSEGEEFPKDDAYVGTGIMVNSEGFDGISNDEGKEKITEALIAAKAGDRDVHYHLRDWLISRQRYWGAPIPIVYCDSCGEVPIPEKDLPVLLPEDVDFRPTGESPLAKSESFHDVRCPTCDGEARRESDTMDTFVDSSWYFLRFPSPHDGERPFSKHAVEYWSPVDLYVGGAEHAVLHLLYARFFTKALRDFGEISFDEPFLRLENPGLIMGEDGQKMSKSLGNVVNPDDVVEAHGADTMRMYEMFMGEFQDAKPWDTKGISGVRRFLDRMWQTVHDTVHENRVGTPHELTRHLHRTIKKVGEDIESFKFNTAISSMMILMNEWTKVGAGDTAFAGEFLKLLAPFAPHISEELWQQLGNSESIFLQPWPSYDEAMLMDETVEVPVQVNGKVRAHLEIATDASDADVHAAALANERVHVALEGKE
ncbi:leucine--tRNA ligase, partial [Patescibacteria group bacterium]